MRRPTTTCLRALIAVAAALALGACSLASEPAAPPMWRVSDGDTTVYLLGSMHVLPPGTDWRDAAVERAIGEADTLVLESDPGAKSEFDTLAKAPGLPPLTERLAPERRGALDKAIARTGQPADAFDGYKDWGAAVMLDTGDAVDAGATAKDGVDAVLWGAFAGKRRVALEQPGAQVRALDILPPQLQRRMLDETLDGPRYETVLDAWSRGDLAALDKASASKELRPFLVTAANRRWAAWIAKRMGQKGKLLVAVGAGHLAGRESIVELLAAKGFKVERVQ
jgi:uncharacterized protein YbaP (TraB family)